MKKKPILFLALLSAVFFLFTTTNQVDAKTKSAKILSTRTLTKTPYHAVSGYLYTSAHLTKKAHNADNYPLTTFYATKSDTVRKANGNKAVYYYIKNGNGKVKGWIWRGHLVRIVDTSAKLKQFNALISLIDSTTTNTHNKIVSVLNTINNDTTLSDLVTKLTTLKNNLTNSSDIAKLNDIITIIKSDFSTSVNDLTNLVNALHTVNGTISTALNGLIGKLSSAS
ncbi:hypothetical protein FD04_GL000440 [Secundilactobacillus odoratitofui DSM 19909 = JCM 15043]|uniref:D-alanyl-D-alanine carboxypeptidase n=1 Tax=Secundilactobacillus odoratitofui DSM 19909 = JCM 15043 TaxID=1423776 RepID=A0A0R1LTA8_9LACO|nr:hypothetical protein [Secundilactobacillus odoratitofui]KRK98704.1 hypothetical protein FD04_GL000440 [Secundilactobacillus odoratitofui DSM 19909 = JCM 15043]